MPSSTSRRTTNRNRRGSGFSRIDVEGNWPGRRQVAARLACAAVLAAATGCATVTTLEPVGSVPVVLAPADWEGSWCDTDQLAEAVMGTENTPADPEGCLQVRVIDVGAGVLQVVDGGESADRPPWVVHVRTVPGRDVRFVTLEREGEPAEHAWYRIAHTASLIVAWEPDAAGFRALVEAGTLPGEVQASRADPDRADVVLGPLDDESLALVADDGARRLFQWDQPTVLVRVRR